MAKSNPLEFLEKSQKDPKLSARVFAAIERGGKVTGDEILQIAKEFGYSFTRNEFEKATRESIAKRFAGGELGLENYVLSKKKRRPKPTGPKPVPPPESSCPKGCLSYTVSWHPPPDTA